MPAYNASTFIQESIDSVLAQDYDSFELLIADDASRDDTFNVIKEYKGHPKVGIYRNRKNLGPGATRNRLIKLARGRYISPCDADDIMLPRNLLVLSQFLDSHPNIGAVYGDVLVMGMDRKGRITNAPYLLGTDYKRGWDLTINLINHGGSLIKKTAIRKAGGYDENVRTAVDWSLWLKLSEITKVKYLKDEVYYVYRKGPHGVSSMHLQKWRGSVLKVLGAAIKRRYDFEFGT